MTDERAEVIAVAKRARVAARKLATATRAEKDHALNVMADTLIQHAAVIVDANSLDVKAAEANGTDPAIIDRLTLTSTRVTEVADALRLVAELDDPVGEVIREFVRPNGLNIKQVRVPMGVVAMIYEARPNVTVDAAGLSLKSGNSVLLRGSSSAHQTNLKLVEVMRAALDGTSIPADAIQLAPGTTHEAAKHLMTARGFVDVIIPRGGEGLISSVVAQSSVPVIETGVGNCHVYVDASADIDMAVSIVVNSKTQRVSVCNTAETLLVHQDIAPEFMPKLLAEFKAKGVTVHGDQVTQRFAIDADTSFVPVTDDDWAAEYYSLDIAAGVVENFDAALEHIRTWSTGHTEAIVSNNAENIHRFTTELDSAVIMVNASTRFTDGGEFGFGAEIGISTQKLHARGPMGLAELTTTSYIVTGNGQIRN